MGRPQPETTTLVFAVSVAVALGVACGVWINARLTAAASETPHAPTRLAHAAPAGQTPPAPDGDPQAAGDDSHQQAASDDSRQTTPTPTGETSPDDSNAPAESQTQSPPDAAGDGRKDRPAPATLPPAAREANPSEKAPEARDKSREVNAGSRAGAGRATPCAPYASAGSLTLRGGGAASLVVGGPGATGRTTVTTPDWSDIAVFSEGRAGGNGWVRYSVRSVSRRPGVYTLHFKTPCGSQSIPVTVTRP